ncbi:hypothetical protein UlMin_027662 [Ulmus minor]
MILISIIISFGIVCVIIILGVIGKKLRRQPFSLLPETIFLYLTSCKFSSSVFIGLDIVSDSSFIINGLVQVLQPSKVETFEEDEILVLEFQRTLPIGGGLRIHLIFRRTGRHLFLINFDEGKPPLLKRMIEDYDDCYFMSALCTFKRRMLYSNVGYDHIVGWRTSSIRRNFEQPKWEDTVNENYPHVVYEEHCKACDAEDSKSTSVDNDNSDKLEEELVTGLSCMSWEKVDVSFQNSRQRFAAYSIIQIELHTVVHMISIFHLLCLP